ncbi:SusC/RagA family TonB-linked outer membrane protein [Mucilaginibacter lappiensis]|uniref:SusC/RagA family TonB-linked outer membrane protein n=1 Tax=Mucilaginibacter lappiensis TaxID=354630 RepID=UPI0021A96967|nr:SusC/RagA family TonB-linked outer membrane protein [Mucilaginibacter lappiensis]
MASVSKHTDDVIVKGSVSLRNSKGKDEKVAGVTVTEKGFSNGTQTDASGQFTIRVHKGAKLIFSMLGYKKHEIEVSATNPALSIVLEEDAATLKEVVVTGYQNLDKNKFTGAATKLKAEDIKMNGTTDIGRMLEGRVAGVSVQNVSGTFGSAPKIQIRGGTSLSGSNKPLWVIDGVVLEDVIDVTNDQLSSGDAKTILGSSVAGLNFNDVEDIYVLKDVAASALYGARAMNGVVVVTTKKGKAGDLRINYTGNFGSELRPSYNNFNIMNSADQMSVYSDMYEKGTLNYKDIGNNSDGGVFVKMDNLLNQFDPVTGKYALQNTPEARNAFLKQYALANTDWFHILFRNSLTQEHNLSFTGGSEKTQSYVSLGVYNDNGWTIADKVRRYTFNAQNTYNVSNKLTVGIITTASLRQQQTPGTVDRIADPVYGALTRDFDINPYNYALNTSRALTAYDDKGNLEYFTKNFAPFNIINELQNNTQKLTALDVKLQGNLSYKINKYLKYDFIGALRYVKTTQENMVNENSNRANAYRANINSTIAGKNGYLYKDPDYPDNQPIVVLPNGGFYNRIENSLASYDLRNTLNYTQSFGKHDLNVLVGQQTKLADRQNAFNTGYGYQYDYGGTPLVDYHIIKQGIEQGRQYYGMGYTYDRFASYFATAGYTYDQRYNFAAAMRYDGSNGLGKSPRARWLPTWSVSGAWNIDKEQFMQDVSSVSYLKLRGSYGLSASAGSATNAAAVYRTQNTYRPSTADIESGIYIQDLENSNLTFEKQYSADIGVDVGFFNGRLNITADIYNKKGFDLIGGILTSGIGGQQVKTGNYAGLKSKGIEFAVGGDIIRQKDWGWKANLVVSYATNKITNDKDIPAIFTQLMPAGAQKEGYPLNSLFSLDFKGLEHSTGIPLFVDEQGNVNRGVNLQSINTQYLKYEGPVNPPYNGGFGNTFRYKAFSLSTQITFQAGNKIRLNSVFQPSYSDLNAMPKEFNDRWMVPGDEKKTNIPSILDALTNYNIGGNYPYNNYNFSSARVANGAFARIKYIALGYQLPDTFAKRIGMNTASVTASATNLWLLFADEKLHGQDPEFFNAGGVAQPLQRQLVLSLKVGF